MGLDFGTLSARGAVLDTADGSIAAQTEFAYPHGVSRENLYRAEDIPLALDRVMRDLTAMCDARAIRAVGVDATGYTMVCLSGDGVPLALTDPFRGREQAQIKLWKRHAAQAQAEEALNLAREREEPFLARTGWQISSEWMLPKYLEMYDADPEAFAAADLVLDLNEYLCFLLTGKILRSAGSAGYKCLRGEKGELPDAAYFDALRPGLAGAVRHVLRGTPLPPGGPGAPLLPEAAARWGLRADVTAAPGILDGHTAPILLGAVKPGDAALILGTSNVLTVQMSRFLPLHNVCGVARDGIVPGLWGVDAGQACTGEMLAWYMENLLPSSVAEAARRAGTDAHALLSSRVKEPWRNPVTVLDWWNGSRNAPTDLTLRGSVHGLSLDTAPEDIYLAMLQGIVCSDREILESMRGEGVRVDRVFAAGGMSGKNPLLMQEYANILHCPVSVGEIREGPAAASALFAALSCGIVPSVEEAYRRMGARRFRVFEPDAEHGAEYEALFRRVHAVRIRNGSNGHGGA